MKPGTVAYSMELQLKTASGDPRMKWHGMAARRSSSSNGHGGNEHLLPFFAQAQLDRPHDYVIYVLDGERSKPGGPPKKINRHRLPRR